MNIVKFHRLKVWIEFWGPIKSGKKTFEIRKNDRNFKVGDILELSAWNPVEKYTMSDPIQFRVTYMTNWEQKEGFVVMAIQPIKRGEKS